MVVKQLRCLSAYYERKAEVDELYTAMAAVHSTLYTFTDLENVSPIITYLYHKLKVKSHEKNDIALICVECYAN